MDRPSDEFLKEAYLRGFDHGSNGYIHITGDSWEDAAYSIGWEDGAQVTPDTRPKADILDRIVERYRAMHGVVQ